jgi:TPR repeat protein
LDKAEALLLQAQKAGNAQSAYQLHILYSTMVGKKNTVKAYRFLNKAVCMGVTHFEAMNNYFKANFEILSPVFAEIRKPPQEMNSRE